MSYKIMNSGELLSNLNRNINKTHHKKVSVQTSHLNQAQRDDNNSQQKVKQSPKLQLQRQIRQKQGKIDKQKHKVSQDSKKESVQNENTAKQFNALQIKDHADRNSEFLAKQDQKNSVLTSLSRASQIRNKYVNFKHNFQMGSHSIQGQELGETLHQILAMQIGKIISQPLAQVIQASMRHKQSMTYFAFTKQDKDYLQMLLKTEHNKQNNNRSQIQNMLNMRQNLTIQKLQNGQLYIDRQRSITTKSQVQQLTKLDVARLLKIKEGVIRSKLDLLQDKMLEVQNLRNDKRGIVQMESLKVLHQAKLEDLVHPVDFSLNSEKTKIANDYVKHLQQQKLVLLRKMRQRQQKRNHIEKQRQMQLKQAEQMRNAAKKQLVQQKIGEHKKKKQSQNSQNKDKSKKVDQFLKQYRKSLPLYKKKQKQFSQIHTKKKQKQFEQKLKDIRQNRRSLSLNQIKQHEDKYLHRKTVQQSKRQEQFKMMLKAKQATSASIKQYFKGFYHDKVKISDQQQKLKFYSMRQSTKLKVQRMTQFDKQIRKRHMPKVDPKKKQALERVIELEELKKKRVRKLFRQVQDQDGQSRLQAYYEQIPEVDHYKQGNRYMQIAKSLAKRTKPQQSSRYSQEQPNIKLQQLQESNIRQRQVNSERQSPSPLISQEKDIWRLRSKQMHQMTEEITPDNFDQVRMNLGVMDDKARLREQLIRHRKSHPNQLMEEKDMLDQFYLQSIKNKIKLLGD